MIEKTLEYDIIIFNKGQRNRLVEKSLFLCFFVCKSVLITK